MSVTNKICVLLLEKNRNFITRKKLENPTQGYRKNFEKTITPISQKKFEKGNAYLPHDFFVLKSSYSPVSHATDTPYNKHFLEYQMVYT